jgi:D-3-phosphoglycerate dehydrogenase
MAKYKVVLTDNIFPDLDLERKMLAEVDAELVVVNDLQDLPTAVADADVVINTYAKVTADLINSMKKCKMIIRNGIGVDTIDIDAASQRGIMVANVPTYCIDEVATHAIALILACNRKIPYLNKEVKAANWNVKLAIPIYPLTGSTLGLMGFGRIARLVGQKAQGLGMKVIAHDPYVPQEDADDYDVTMVNFETLLRESDFISIHCPLLPSTKGLFNYETFKKVKKTAYIINTARGPLIDELGLVKALQEGEIAGAGLDVLKENNVEAGDPLLSFDNVIITPHAGWYSEGSIVRRRTQTIENVIKVLQGGEPDSFVNRKTIVR